jgi:hypothetical protein
MNISRSRLQEFSLRARITPNKKRGDFALNGRMLWAVEFDTVLRNYHADIVMIKLSSLLFRVLVRIVFGFVVITILPYCPLMS